MKNDYKVKALLGVGKTPKWRVYALLTTGSDSLRQLVKFELITLLCANLGGAPGLFLRGKLYRALFRSVGKNVVFGKGITLRHPHKITIGDDVIIDDFCVLDAKGEHNQGIHIGPGAFIGRNTIIYCKDGDIEIDAKVNCGVNSVIYSKNRVHIGAGTMIAAFAHIMSGGQYDYRSPVPLSEQSSGSSGATSIGKGCWLGSKVVVQDGVHVGSGTVIGSGSVVTRALPANVVAMGVPAKVKSSIERRTPEADIQ